jgi:hypothetical protein
VTVAANDTEGLEPNCRSAIGQSVTPVACRAFELCVNFIELKARIRLMVEMNIPKAVSDRVAAGL